MIGTYRFYQHGELVAAQRNLITTAGKAAILRTLAQGGGLASTMAFGVGTTAAALGDTALTFEVARAILSSNTIDVVNSRVIYKTTIPKNVSMNIRETGLWTLDSDPQAGNYGSRLLQTFEGDVDYWTAGTYETANTRVGERSLRVTATVSSTATSVNDGFVNDLSGFSGSEPIKLACYVANSNTSAIQLLFYNANGSFFRIDYNTPSSGYQILSANKSSAAVSGSPTWSDIVKLEVRVIATGGGSAIVDFDGIRVEDTDTLNPNYSLVSRAVLGSPVAKTNVAAMDVEYSLDVSI